jgi:hypothetical protein
MVSNSKYVPTSFYEVKQDVSSHIDVIFDSCKDLITVRQTCLDLALFENLLNECCICYKYIYCLVCMNLVKYAVTKYFRSFF